jgi:hypothetical protein
MASGRGASFGYPAMKRVSRQSAREIFRFVVLLFLGLSLCASPGKSVEQPTSGGPSLRGPAQTRTALRSSPIFVFHSDEFWLNLHHFLYVLGRAQNKTRDASRDAVAGAPVDQENGLASLKPNERTIWHEAVAWYATGPSRKDLVFDDPLPEVTNTLVRVGKVKSPAGAGVDPSLAAVLARAAPIYRKAWWPKHRAANQAWQTAIQLLVKKYGAPILTFITNAYGMEWPAGGYGVHLSAYSNWAGAYSTKGNLLVVSSLNVGTEGTNGLETVFHEGMHQWDDLVLEALREQAQRIGKPVPANLSHALIFFTAGEAVHRVVPEHLRYADKFGVWRRGWTRERDALEEIWKPYLDGHGTRDEAFAELIKRLATEPGKDEG